MESLLVRQTRRRDVYSILATCYRAPDSKFIETLRSLCELPATSLGELASNAAAIDDIQPLKIDHSKLFVGPFKPMAPPYGSVYLEDNRLMGDSTAAVRELYTREDLQITLKEPPDYIVVELEFMCFLIIKETEAIERDNSQAIQEYRQKQEVFLREFLCSWIEPFTIAIVDHAQTEFYRTLGRVTRDFVERDIETLNDDSTYPTALTPDNDQSEESKLNRCPD